MKYVYKRITKILLIWIGCIMILPFNSLAKTVDSSASIIKGYEDSKGFDYIYFGKKGDSAIKWKVLSVCGNAVNEGDKLTDDSNQLIDNTKAILLLSDEYIIAQKALYPEGTTGRQVKYPISLAKQWCDKLAENGQADDFTSTVGNDTIAWESGARFSALELQSILNVTKDEPGGFEFESLVSSLNVTSELENAKFFLPSVSEMLNPKYGFSNNIADSDENRMSEAEVGHTKSYYLRTIASAGKSAKGATYVDDTGKIAYQIDASWGNSTQLKMHLAANFNKDAVIFVTDARNEKDTLSKVEENSTHEWKLTLKEDKDFSTEASIDMTTTAPGKELTITHKKLSELSDSYTNVTAAIYDPDGNLLYYGSINDDKEASESKIKIPEDIADGTYTLKVFGETWNGAENTDIATATPFETELIIDSVVTAANEVTETISNLPDLDKITLSDKAAVEAARKAYDALTDEQKAKVDTETLKKLTDAEAKIAELTKAEDNKESDKKPATTISVKKGTKFNVKGYKYTVTGVSIKNPTVTITGYKNKKLKKIVIPATVTYKKVKFKVTAVGNGAFKGQKKAVSITIGANVINIGKAAFSGDAKAKKIFVKTKVLKKVGAKAYQKINKKAVIKVPAKKYKAYKKLMKGKGQAKTVKIIK
jgi:hypothetical protein